MPWLIKLAISILQRKYLADSGIEMWETKGGRCWQNMKRPLDQCPLATLHTWRVCVCDHAFLPKTYTNAGLRVLERTLSKLVIKHKP